MNYAEESIWPRYSQILNNARGLLKSMDEDKRYCVVRVTHEYRDLGKNDQGKPIPPLLVHSHETLVGMMQDRTWKECWNFIVNSHPNQHLTCKRLFIVRRSNETSS